MTKDELRDYIIGHFEGKLTLLDTGRYDPIFEVKPADLVETARALRDDEQLRFDFFCCLSAVDTGERFEAVYSLASINDKHRVDIKIFFPYDAAELDSVGPGLSDAQGLGCARFHSDAGAINDG